MNAEIARTTSGADLDLAQIQETIASGQERRPEAELLAAGDRRERASRGGDT